VEELEQDLRRLEEDIARERRIGFALREVGLALGTTLNLDELLVLILEKINDAVDAERSTLYLLDEPKRELVSRIVQGDEVRQIRLKIGQGIAGHVAKTSEPLIVNDPYDDPRFNAELDHASGFRTRSLLAVPMKNHLGRTIGVIQALNQRTGAFTEHDAVVLVAISTQAAVAIDNSRLFNSVTQKNTELLATKEKLEHRVRDLKLLFELESVMGRASTLEELYTGVLTEALRTSGASSGAFVMKGADGLSGQMHVMQRGAAALTTHAIQPNAGLVGAAITRGDVVFSNNVPKHPSHDKFLDERLGEPTRSCIAVPLEGEEGDAMGAIALFNKRGPSGSTTSVTDAAKGEAFTEDDRALLLLIAANASTAMRLQMAREAREREERLSSIGRLLSGVIHDMRTPLTVISGYVQMMQSTEKRTQREEYARLALKQFDHLAAMQRDLLEFARGERNTYVRKVYLARFFGEVKEQLEAQLARVGVELRIDLQDRGTARFDEGKVLRVVHNLARNAAEAMGEKGGKFTIKVTRAKVTRAAGEALVITFSDTGPGIPKDIEHRLFQSFVTSGKKGGTGLGLAITKRIAEEHGGTISVKSSSKGAVFTLRLPQASTENA
jgi:signal transduction histidine kinase